LQPFWPLQAFLAVLQALLPLQALAPTQWPWPPAAAWDAGAKAPVNINAAAAAAIEAPDITEGFMSYSFLVLIGLGTGSVTRQNAVSRNTSQQEDVMPREHSHQWALSE
jgi:hypothetical protein